MLDSNSNTILPIIGSIPPSWKVVRFGDLLIGGVRNGVYKPKEFHGTGCKIVNMGELFGNPRLYDIPMKRIQLEKREIEKSSVERGDLLFARRSLVAEGAGKCCLVCEVNEPTTFESSIIRARPNPEKADSSYLYYLFCSSFGLFLLDTIRRHVAVAGITGADLMELEIPVPPLADQRRIALILSSLDYKIELNRKIDQTLEAIARAIFKSWFIDFDPVRAKMEGRKPEGMDENMARLFPNAFVESHLGKIPAGFSVCQLGDVLAELVSGSRPTGGAISEGIPSIGAENVLGLGLYDYGKTKYIPSDFFQRIKEKGAAIRRGDVLLYKDGAQVGRKTMFDCGFPFEECAVNEHVFILRCKPGFSQSYLFFWLDQDWMTQAIIALNSNSAQPGINQPGVRSLDFMSCGSDLMQAFDNLVAPLLNRIFANCIESNCIASLRDSLLPRLLAGNLKINGEVC